MSSQRVRNDPAWKYADLVDLSNRDRFKCRFCDKISNAGVYRVKHHLAGGFQNVTSCPKCPPEVRQEIRDFMSQKKSMKEQLHMMTDIDDDVLGGDEESDIPEMNP